MKEMIKKWEDLIRKYSHGSRQKHVLNEPKELAVYSLPDYLILGELLNLPTEMLETRTDALIALQQFFAETHAVHKALIAVGVKNLDVLSSLPHRDWTHVIASCLLKEEGIAYSLAHHLPDTHLSVLSAVYQKQGDWHYKGMLCALEGFAKVLDPRPEQMSWLTELAQWLVKSQTQAPGALRQYYQKLIKQSSPSRESTPEDEDEFFPAPPKLSLEPMLLAIKKAESQIDKHIAEGEQALSEEKEAIELWLVAREKEYLSCKQQLKQLIAETQGMDATLRARYQAMLQEINTHFAEVRAELYHNKEKSIKGIRRKAVTSIAVMVGACALAYALAPVLSSAIGSATSLGANASHMATLEAILKGGIMGGINGAFAKENILKATLKGAGFAALGCVVNGLFGDLITEGMSRHYETVNKAMASAAEAGLRVAIEQGDARNIISTVGTGLLLDKLPFDAAATTFLADLRQNIVKSFIGGTIYAGITRQDFGSSVAEAIVSGIAYTAGAHLGKGIAEPIVKQHFPEMHKEKARAVENAKAAAAAKSIQLQEKPQVQATPLPGEQSTILKKTQPPAVAEADSLETRKTKIKIKTAGSKPKPKIPPKAAESTKRYGLAESSFEQELDHVHSTTENLLLDAKILKTYRDIGGGLRNNTLPEGNVLGLNTALFEPQTNVTGRALLWQKPIYCSRENTTNQRLSASKKFFQSKKQVSTFNYPKDSCSILDWFVGRVYAEEGPITILSQASDESWSLDPRKFFDSIGGRAQDALPGDQSFFPYIHSRGIANQFVQDFSYRLDRIIEEYQPGRHSLATRSDLDKIRGLSSGFKRFASLKNSDFTMGAEHRIRSTGMQTVLETQGVLQFSRMSTIVSSKGLCNSQGNISIRDKHPIVAGFFDGVDAGCQTLDNFFNRANQHCSMVPNTANKFAVTLLLGGTASRTIIHEARILYSAYNLHKSSDVTHIFPKDNSHNILDTLFNRRAILKLVSQRKNFLGKDQYGNDWYAKIGKDGVQSWAQMRGNRVMNAGKNYNPRTFHPKTGLSSPIKPGPRSAR